MESYGDKNDLDTVSKPPLWRPWLWMCSSLTSDTLKYLIEGEALINGLGATALPFYCSKNMGRVQFCINYLKNSQRLINGPPLLLGT